MAVASNSPIVWIMGNPSLNQWECVAGLRGHSANILAVDAVTVPRPDYATFLASASRDHTTRVWRKYVNEEIQESGTNWRCISTAEGHTDAVSAFAFSPRVIAPPAG